jgi:hypothetical protein
MPRAVQYNRKINAPIRFLYYLEIIDLFILLVIGVLAPLFASSFLPVDIPLWHSLIWFGLVFFLLVLIKVGRAPGFVPHWIGKTFRAKAYHPGLKELEYFILPPNLPPPPKPGDPIFTPAELQEIQSNVLKLSQSRREEEMMQQKNEFSETR